MERKLLIKVVLTLVTVSFAVCSHAAIRQCDFSDPRDIDIDGSDLTRFIAHYSAGDPATDVDGVGGVSPADVSHFAIFFGKSRLPNILLIIADDVGLDVTTDMYPGLIEDLLALYGLGPGDANYSKVNGKPASTPKLDTFAQQGMRFSNSWAQPFCSPTRASIITGMFAAKTNVAAYDEPMSTSHTTFVERLRDEAGYSTAIFGKWHLAGGWSGYNDAMPKRMGFELFKGHLDSAIPNYWNYKYQWQDENSPDSQIEESDTPPARSLAGIAATTFAPVVRAADTIEYITTQQSQKLEKPWFVWLALNQAHVVVGGDRNSSTLISRAKSRHDGCSDPD